MDQEFNKDLDKAASQYPSIIRTISPQWETEIENAFKAGAQWQALHSLETIKGMEEQAFLAGVEAEQINKSFSKEELLNKWKKVFL